jgi:NAD(P)H dehydrogenase (quinone)
MIAVTGASGHLGRLVVSSLLKKVPPGEVVAAVRTPEKVQDFASKGVVVRQADYSRPETLAPAFAGVEKLLLISGSEVGRRIGQHKAVISAAKQAGVKLIAYTSLLHCDKSPVAALREEHWATEEAIRASGIPFAILRNGWYTENYSGAIVQAVKRGAHYGCANGGRISAASRADYADAAVAVLTAKDDAQSRRVYELAGDQAFTFGEFAAEVAKQSGKPVTYQDLPEAEYKALLVKAGLPEPIATMLASADAGIAKGALFDDGRQLHLLIGRATAPISATIAAALASQ